MGCVCKYQILSKSAFQFKFEDIELKSQKEQCREVDALLQSKQVDLGMCTIETHIERKSTYSLSAQLQIWSVSVSLLARFMSKFHIPFLSVSKSVQS